MGGLRRSRKDKDLWRLGFVQVRAEVALKMKRNGGVYVTGRVRHGRPVRVPQWMWMKINLPRWEVGWC